ncbi:MAG: M18 family aminopeptidase [Desulfobacterales bacterium]|nr:M18 family aminopeptidase [Desulfobacterales bacterium]
MTENKFNKQLISFLSKSVSPYHCITESKKILKKAGFKELKEKDKWTLKDGESYYVTKNSSSLIAFVYIKGMENKGYRITGAHTDSPCLKLKPVQDMIKDSYVQLATEVYGGPVLSTWFDRDLSIAGKICYTTNKDEIKTTLIDFKEPVAIIPNLAIHLSRSEKNKEVGKQKELPPVLFQSSGKEDFNKLLKNEISKSGIKNIKKIMDHELFLYDTQKPSISGLKKEFITGGKLDNLLSCFAGLQAICNGNKKASSILVLNDHEEVGNTSNVGAQGPFLLSVLERISKTREDLWRSFDNSMIISSDNAHGVHPNYSEKFDPSHKPLLNSGPVIKYNANQRYASNCETTSIFKMACDKVKVPYQSFVMRSDMPCGTTIGPTASAKTGIKAIDIGVPTFGMHSIRETAGIKDCYLMYKAILSFNNIEVLPI